MMPRLYKFLSILDFEDLDYSHKEKEKCIYNFYFRRRVTNLASLSPPQKKGLTIQTILFFFFQKREEYKWAHLKLGWTIPEIVLNSKASLSPEFFRLLTLLKIDSTLNSAKPKIRHCLDNLFYPAHLLFLSPFTCSSPSPPRQTRPYSFPHYFLLYWSGSINSNRQLQLRSQSTL